MAFLIASAVLSGTAGNFGAHAIPALSPASPGAKQLVAEPAAVLDPEQTLLRRLVPMDAVALADFVEHNSTAIRKLLLNPPSAQSSADWWQNISAPTRANFMQSAPEIVGNLPGVPYATRDLANRRFLSETINGLEQQVHSGVGRGAAAEVDARLSMLRAIEEAMAKSGANPRRSLIMLDTVWPGRAAISLGNLSAAEYVSYLVPGMFFTIEGQVGDWADTAARLHADQTSWLEVLGDTAGGTNGNNIATVAWMGYQTPNVFNVGSETLADEGALYLASSMDALYTERADAPPFVSVLAHSYGSTTAMKALATGRFNIDAFAIVGSPGSKAQNVDQLHVRNGNVFVGEASWDPVVNTAFFGSDPGAASFGAKRMSVQGGVDGITQENLAPSVGHNEYFAVGSESLRNMALLGIDRGYLVTKGNQSDEGKTLALMK